MPEPKKASDLATQLFNLDDPNSPIRIIDDNDPAFIELTNKLKRERERDILLEDLRRAKIPKKHFRLLDEMTEDRVPELYKKIRRSMKGNSVLIFGEGKTKTLSSCTWLVWKYKQGESIFYTKGLDLVLELSNFNTRNKSSYVRRVNKTSSLVIDDIHNIYNSEINISNIANLISNRNDNCKSTILISSSPIDCNLITKVVSENVELVIAV